MSRGQYCESKPLPPYRVQPGRATRWTLQSCEITDKDGRPFHECEWDFFLQLDFRWHLLSKIKRTIFEREEGERGIHCGLVSYFAHGTRHVRRESRAVFSETCRTLCQSRDCREQRKKKMKKKPRQPNVAHFLRARAAPASDGRERDLALNVLTLFGSSN